MASTPAIRWLSRFDIMAAVDKLIHAGERGAAAGLRKHAYAFLGWALEQGYIDANPQANLPREVLRLCRRWQ